MFNKLVNHLILKVLVSFPPVVPENSPKTRHMVCIVGKANDNSSVYEAIDVQRSDV